MADTGARADVRGPAVDPRPGQPLELTEDAASRPRTVRTRGAVLERILDGTLDVAVAALALWTLLYWLALAGLDLGAALAAWGVGVLALAAWRVRASWTAWLPPSRPGSSWVAVTAAVALALISSVISRPEWDDAAYVVRSTWVAEHGALPSGDFVFNEPGWPVTFGTVTNVSSVEALLGVLARALGLQAGDAVYRFAVPLLTFAAVWALWLLLRMWQARRPAASLLLALLFLVLGGYATATWGNFHLARIWQGKAMLVAIAVPYVYAALATVTRRRATPISARGLRRIAAVFGMIGVAAVGMSSTAVFVVPLVVAVGSVWLLVHRRVREAVVAVAASCLGPAVAAVMTLLTPLGPRNIEGTAVDWLWVRVLGDDLGIGLLVAGAALLTALGVWRPSWFRSTDPDIQAALPLALLGGFLCTVPPLYDVLTVLTGGDAIAYRLAWVLPLPAVVGLLASLPARRWAAPVLPAVALGLVAILAAGQPLWSPVNGASVGRPGTWKVRDQADLAAARWIVAQDAPGRYLAPNWVTMQTGVLTSRLRPVGTRVDYMTEIDGIPGGMFPERELLQSVADTVEVRTPENLAAAADALDALDVRVACVVWDDAFTQQLFDEAGFEPGLAAGPWTCRSLGTGV